MIPQLQTRGEKKEEFSSPLPMSSTSRGLGQREMSLVCFLFYFASQKPSLSLSHFLLCDSLCIRRVKRPRTFSHFKLSNCRSLLFLFLLLQDKGKVWSLERQSLRSDLIMRIMIRSQVDLLKQQRTFCSFSVFSPHWESSGRHFACLSPKKICIVCPASNFPFCLSFQKMQAS